MPTDSGAGETGGAPSLLRHMELGGLLGRGNMGAVYAATVKPPAAPQKIAVRILSSRFYADPGFINRFYQHANNARRLRHPNLVRVLDVAEVGGRHCLAMELVEGVPLDQWMRSRGKVAEPKMLLIASAITNALHHALHKERLVHGAVRPQNIFTDKSGGLVRLGDVGLARAVFDERGHKVPQAPVNDPHYTAPELTLGKPQTEPAGDIYALGATLYHLATGMMPFGHVSAEQALLEQRGGFLRNAKELNPDLSDGFCLVLEKMLAREPEDRYADYEALIADLRTLSTGGRLNRPAWEAGRSVMERRKVAAPAMSAAANATMVAQPIAPAVKAGSPSAVPARARTGAMPPPTKALPPAAAARPVHHHPSWMTTPMVIGAWIMVFVLIIACWIAWHYRVSKQQKIQWEFDSQSYAKPTEPAPMSAGERARRALESVEAYEKKSPKDVAGIIDKYERVTMVFPGTTPARTAEQRLAKLRPRQRASSSATNAPPVKPAAK